MAKQSVGAGDRGRIIANILQVFLIIFLIIVFLIIIFLITRSCAALRAADLDWIVGPGYRHRHKT